MYLCELVQHNFILHCVFEVVLSNNIVNLGSENTHTHTHS